MSSMFSNICSSYPLNISPIHVSIDGWYFPQFQWKREIHSINPNWLMMLDASKTHWSLRSLRTKTTDLTPSKLSLLYINWHAAVVVVALSNEVSKILGEIRLIISLTLRPAQLCGLENYGYYLRVIIGNLRLILFKVSRFYYSWRVVCADYRVVFDHGKKELLTLR